MTDLEHEMRQQLRAEGWRFCHNRSARKHRRNGDEVRYFGGGLYAWRPNYGIWLRAAALTTQHPEGGDGR